MCRIGSSTRARGLALALLVCAASGCGEGAIKVAGGTEGPPPATEKARKAADAESKIIKNKKLR